MGDYPRRIKKLLRELMTDAYEVELHREQTKLDESFAEWRAGRMSSGELSHRVHQYDTGPARELHKHYNYGPHDMSVAYAIVTGVLKRDQLPAELLQAIKRPPAFYQSLKDRDEMKEPE